MYREVVKGNKNCYKFNDERK